MRSSVVRLTTTQIAALKPGPRKRDIADAAVRGLVLRIGTQGSKYWLFRYMWKGKGIRISLGMFPLVGLAEARKDAIANRELLEKGIDPRKAKRRTPRKARAKATSSPGPIQAVGAVAALGIRSTAPGPKKTAELLPPQPDDRTSIHFLAYEYVERYVKAEREDAQEVIRILNKDVLPEWRERDARTITAREVIELLDGIVSRGAPVMANRTADVLGQMFKYGIHRQIVADSPVKLLYKPGGKEKPRKRALREEELLAFIHGLDEVCTSKRKVHILRVLLLTMQRRAELGRAEWTEFDFDQKTWTIPDHHAKMRRGHVLPLTDWAIAELEALKELAKGSRFVVPNSRGDQPAHPSLITRSVTRLRKRFQSLGVEPFTVHDLRRTGRTGLARLKVPKHTAERVLNHSKEVIEGTYDVYEYFNEKRTALRKWERRLLELKASPRPEALEKAIAELIAKRRAPKNRRKHREADLPLPAPATSGHQNSLPVAPDRQTKEPGTTIRGSDRIAA